MTADFTGWPFRSDSNRLVVDRDACVGSSLCEQIAPLVFELDEEGRSSIIGDPAQYADLVREAEENCPVAAIRYEPQSAPNEVP
jgi:ferredoxin